MKLFSNSHSLGNLGACSRGASVIEFAVVAPFIAFLLMGIVDLSRGVSAKMFLQQAAARSIELATVRTNDGDYAQLRAEAAAAAKVPLQNVTVDKWLECDGPPRMDFDGVCQPAQQSSRFVKVTISGSFDPSFNYGPLGRYFADASANGTVPLRVSSTVRVQ